MKRQLWDLPFQTLHEAVIADSDEMLRANVCEDFEEGKRAFMEKRKPHLHRTLSKARMDLRRLARGRRLPRATCASSSRRSCRTTSAHGAGFPARRARRLCALAEILHARGWGAPGWPSSTAAAGWNAVQRNIFEEECFVGGAPRQMPFGLSMVAPVLMKFGTPAQKAALPAEDL